MRGRGLRRRAIWAFCLIVVAAMAGAPVGREPLTGPRRVAAARVAFGALPLRFEANRGQADARVRFLSRGHGYTLFLTPTEAVLALRPGPPGPAQAGQARGTSPGRSAGTPPAVLRLQLVGASGNPEIVGLEELPGRSHYFRGNDPKGWRTGIPSYARVAYRGVYPGVDLVFYGTQGHLEYDLVLAPGADPGGITLALTGADHLAIDAQGDLVVQTAGGEVRQHKPRIYQAINGVQQPIPGRYVLKGRDRVGVHVAAYDPGRPLVIDPVLSYSTYLGGGSNDEGRGIAVDSAGNIYVTGSTASADFPTTGGFRSTSGGGTAGGFGASRDASGFDPSPTSPFQASHGGSDDVFVTKLNAAGSALVYSTYIGGTGLDQGLAIAVDRDGNAHVTGVTESTNFPLVNPVQAARAGGRDAFVAKLNASGSALVYSTYLGGTDGDSGNAIAVDSGGNAYVTGSTSSANNFPTTAGAFQTTGSVDADFAFVTKLNASGSGLVYSTYLGGGEVPAPSSAVASRPFSTGRAIAVDSGGSAYVTGSTSSGAFPTTAGAFQAVHSGPRAEPGSRVRVGFDEVVFVTKLNAAGSGLVYSTYVGVGGIHTTSIGTAIAVDSAGHAFVAGYTDSIEFPTTGGAFQTALAGDLDDTTDDAFVTKLNATGSALVYSTYIGGRGLDQALGMAVDAAGNAHITGSTRSSNFPLVNPIQAALAGGRGDAFVTKLNAEGSALLYSTYLGGAGDELEGSAVDRGNGLVLDTAGNVYVIGVTSSPNFPTRSPFQDRRAGRDDAFVAKITPDIGEASLSGAGGPSGDVGAAEGGGGCLIATAAFGSPLAPQVQRLRALRDRYLLPHGAGRAIVAMYDRVSPPLAQRVAGSALLRDMVRIALVPVLGWAGLVLWSPGVGLGFPVGAVGLGVWLALQCGRRRRQHRRPVPRDPEQP